MKVELVNFSKRRIVNRQFLQSWMRKVINELKRRKTGMPHWKKKLTIAFITSSEMKRLNHLYRNKNQVTDVLSFSSSHSKIFCQEKLSLGELALCPQYIHKQATKQGISIRQETAYVLLHGLLHLLGYEHEKNQREAQKMFRLQDEIFFKLFRSKL